MSSRTSADIKHLLRMAAEKEHRSIASMLEVLILEYARHHGLSTSTTAVDDKVCLRWKRGAGRCDWRSRIGSGSWRWCTGV